MTQLYVLAAQYREAAEKLAELDLPPEVVADTLESLSGEIEAKAPMVAMMARNLEATASAIKEAEAEMAARRKAIENRAASIRRYLMENLQACGITKMECPQFSIRIASNPPSVDVFDEGQIPAQFMKQPEPPPPSPDKTAIKSALNSGVDVPGCRLVRGQRIEIK